MNASTLISTLTLLVGVILVGHSTARILRAPSRFVLPLGFAVLAIVVTCAVITANLSIAATRWVVGVLIAATLLQAQTLRAYARESATLGGLVLVTYFLIVLPAWIGGPQFFVFRGNWWDHFNYLAGVQSITYHNVAAIRVLAPELAVSDPITVYGVIPLSARPAVVLLAAVFHPKTADIFAYAYSYLALLLALLVGVIAPALERLASDARSRRLGHLIAISIPIGFWGQLLLDSSVWSHIASLPILAMICYDMLLETPAASRVSWIRQWPPMFVLLLGGFLIYPEGTVVVMVLLLMARVIADKSLSKPLPFLAIFAASIVLAGVIDYSGSVRLFIDQAKAGVGSWEGPSNWYLYTLQPYFGFNFTDLFRGSIDKVKAINSAGGPLAVASYILRARPEIALLPLNVLPILLGFYPIVNWVAARSVIASAAVSFALLFCLGWSIACAIKRDRSDGQVIAFASFLPGFILLILSFVAMAKLWEAGKALSFVVPLLVPMFFVLLLRYTRNDRRANQFALAATVLMIFGSGYFALARAWLALDPSGIGHASPFPSVLRADDKEFFRYGSPPQLKSCRSVAVTERHPNRALFLLIDARQTAPAWFGQPFSYYGIGATTYSLTPRRADCTIQFDTPSFGGGLSRPRVVLGGN